MDNTTAAVQPKKDLNWGDALQAMATMLSAKGTQAFAAPAYGGGGQSAQASPFGSHFSVPQRSPVAPLGFNAFR